MATVAANAKEIEELKIRVSHIERVVILGDGDRLPLAEIVRTLTKTVESYIAQKDKEEQQKKEADEKKQKAEMEKEEEKKIERNKWKWLIISIVVPLLITFAIQAFVVFFKIWPILSKLAE
jgi:hypothetical protein